MNQVTIFGHVIGHCTRDEYLVIGQYIAHDFKPTAYGRQMGLVECSLLEVDIKEGFACYNENSELLGTPTIELSRKHG